MDVGTYLLWLSVLTASGAAALSLFSAWSGVPAYRRLARPLLLPSFLLATAALALLLYAFQVSDFTFDYVLRNSRVTYDWSFKLAGLWAGDPGALFLWAWFIGLSLVVEEALQWRRRRRPDAPPERAVQDWVRLIVAVVFAGMVLLVIQMNLLARTNPVLLASPAGTTGLGFNPLLETPMVVFHPPMEFAGYAFVT